MALIFTLESAPPVSSAVSFTSAESTFLSTEITNSGNSGSRLENDPNPATGDVSIYDGKIIRQFGTEAKIRFQIIFDADDTITLDLLSLIPSGGKILEVHARSQNGAHEPYADISLYKTGDSQLRINRADSIDLDVTWMITAVVDGFPEIAIAAPVP